MDLGIPYMSDVTVIGRGGFSVVYAATDTRFDRRVAVKIIGQMLSDRDRLRFERECRVMGRLSAHPNVVTVFDAGHTENGHPYLVMELIEDGSLADYVERDGPIPWARALEYLIPVVDALGHGHRQGILHRDVKPENILLAGDRPRLTDFGIASVRDTTGSTSTHIAASWHHAPPETFDNQRVEQSDLYSVGSTLFSVITGHAPFWRPSEESLHPLMRRLLSEPAPHLPSELGPQALDAVLQRCLAKEPGLRPISADALIADLQLVLSRQESPAAASFAPPSAIAVALVNQPLSPLDPTHPGQPVSSGPDSIGHRPSDPPRAPAPQGQPGLQGVVDSPSEAKTVARSDLPGPPAPATGHVNGRAKDSPSSRRLLWLIASVVGVVAVLASVVLIAWPRGDGSGSGADGENGRGGTADPLVASPVPNGEVIDGGTFIGSPPEHIDPALNSSNDANQVIDALYDGLTDLDRSDPQNPRVVPDVASVVIPNDDATVWTFKIRGDEFFSDGEQILPSTFARSWNRAAHMKGAYSYLIGFLDGGREVIDGTASEISGVKADDASMTLTVTLDFPYASFDALVGFQFFYPVHSETASISDQTTYDSKLIKGNGPYMLERPRTNQEITLIPNPRWNGSAMGVTAPGLARIEFRVMADADASFDALTAGQVDVAEVPVGRDDEARQGWATTLDTAIAGSYYWVINSNSSLLGGPQNLKLREAIDLAINRDEINRSAFGGLRILPTGVTPSTIPGFAGDLCKVCAYNLADAQAAYDEWTATGGRLTEPIPLQFNADAGHEQVAQIMISNLAAIGIEAVAEPMEPDSYFLALADGGCKHLCRSGWLADYPIYDGYMYDLFHTDSIGGNNLGPFVNADFDRLVTEARRTPDKARSDALYHEAESIVLDDVGVIPISWSTGSYAYENDKITALPLDFLGGIRWEQVTVAQ